MAAKSGRENIVWRFSGVEIGAISRSTVESPARADGFERRAGRRARKCLFGEIVGMKVVGGKSETASIESLLNEGVAR
jgi:hypothetical protein